MEIFLQGKMYIKTTLAQLKSTLTEKRTVKI